MAAITGMPDLVTEVAFGWGPFQLSPTPTWVDISSYVRNCTINRGRQYELDDFEAGTCQMTLNNADSRFDPMNPTGPYQGYLIPNTPIRVSATWNGTTYRLFYGYVERWPPARLSPRGGQGSKYYSEAQITATDAFGLFANWRFPLVDDGIGGGVKLLGTWNYQNATWTNNASFAAPDEAVRVYGLVDITEYPDGLGKPHGQFHNLTVDVTYTNGSGTTGRQGQFVLKHRWQSVHPTHVGERKHHGKKSYARPGHAKADHWGVEIDMRLQGNDTLRSIQNVQWKSGDFTGKNVNLRIYGERALIPRATGDVQLQAALNYQGFPLSQFFARHAGRFTQLPSSPWDNDLLTVIRQIQDTEMGQIFVDRSGVVIFEDRDYRYNNWPGSFIWHDGGGTGPYIYTEVYPSFDNQHVVTVWEVTRVSRGANDTPVMQSATSSAATQYGLIKGQRTTSVQTDAEALKQAQYLLSFTPPAVSATPSNPTPPVRIPQLTVRPRKDPSNLWPQILPLDLGNGMTVRQYPPLGPSSTFMTQGDYWVEHIAHTITPDDWVTDLQLSPRMNVAFPA